jgi:hypothetical protein
MKKLYIFNLLAFFFIASAGMAQTIVSIPASTDPTMPTDIFPIIMGDTTATGERNDNNTIYKLQNGAVYITTGRIVNKPEWGLNLEAEDLNDTGSKPVIARIPNASGTYPDIMRPEGNVTLRNIWFVVGERGALEQHDWGKIRYMGDNTRVIADHCIFEKDRGGFFQLRGNNIKLYVTNCILRNGGNRRILQGNGRGVDARNTSLDTLIMRNTIVHNIQDRFFRSQGATEPHNYIEIDNCTSFNTAGRHGFIQLGRVNTAKITNNLFIDPIMLGSSPVYTDEQTQPDNDLHKVITLDTLYDNTSLTISNNNIFWNQDVVDYWASNDSVSAPGLLSSLVMDNLGAASAEAAFEETLVLNSVPGTILEYVSDLYANPAADDMFDFIVEDVALAGTDFDSGNLFEFSTFDPCYPSSSQSATAGTNGGAVGAVSFCFDLTSTSSIKEIEALQVFPNPTQGELNVSFDLLESSDVSIQIMDMNGSLIRQNRSQKLSAGQHQYSFDLTGQLASGMFLLSIQTEQGVSVQKIIFK